MKFRDYTTLNLTANIQEDTETDSQKLEFDNFKQQLFMLTMGLSAYLWAHIARSPFNYTITARVLLAKCDDY